MNVTLEIDDALGRRLENVGLPVVLGRGTDCDLQLADPCVSRRHCRIDCVSDEALVVCDLGSTNGTFVDGVRVGEASLSPGIRMSIGDAEITLRQSGGWRRNLQRLVSLFPLGGGAKPAPPVGPNGSGNRHGRDYPQGARL